MTDQAKICAHCGERFDIDQHARAGGRSQIYCSPRCRRAAWVKKSGWQRYRPARAEPIREHQRPPPGQTRYIARLIAEIARRRAAGITDANDDEDRTANWDSGI